jgi:hypothetical protein
MLLFLLIACEENRFTCTPPELSKDTLSFSTQGGIDRVSVSNSFWWLTSYGFTKNGCDEIYDSDTDYCVNNYCSHRGEIIKAKCSWFELQKTDAYTITVSVNPNETNQERHFRVFMQAGNCGTSFTITQSAK